MWRTPRRRMSSSAPEWCRARIDPPCPSGLVATSSLAASSIRPLPISKLGMTPWGKNITSARDRPKNFCCSKNAIVASWFSGLVMMYQGTGRPQHQAAAHLEAGHDALGEEHHVGAGQAEELLLLEERDRVLRAAEVLRP